MYWVTAKSAVVSAPRWFSIGLLLRSHPPRRSFTSSQPSSIRQPKQIYCFKGRKTLKTNTNSAKKLNVHEEKDYPHIIWWKEKMQMCRKTSSAQLVKRLTYSNLLGLDDNLKNGSLKEGTLNSEILKFKSRFPREVLLCRVGDFYEALGFDACILVEYAGLNPFGGLRSDSIPKAGCPVVNLRQTLDDLTRNGFSVRKFRVQLKLVLVKVVLYLGMRILEVLMFLDLLKMIMILSFQSRCQLLESLVLQRGTALFQCWRP